MSTASDRARSFFHVLYSLELSLSLSNCCLLPPSLRVLCPFPDPSHEVVDGVQCVLHCGVSGGGHRRLGGLGRGTVSAVRVGVDLAERHVAQDEALLTRAPDSDESGRVEIGDGSVRRTDGVEGVLEESGSRWR